MFQTNKLTDINLHYCENLSENYRARIKAVIKEIIDSDAVSQLEYFVPYIFFPGMDGETLIAISDTNYKYQKIFNP